MGSDKFEWGPDDIMLEDRSTPILRRIVIRGGPGSGHFGHEGRPGQRGGSQPGEGGDERRYNVEGGHAPRGFSESDYGEHEGVTWIWNPSGVQAEQRLGEPGVGGWQGWRKANISLSARPTGYRVVLTHGRTRSNEDARFVSPTLDDARKAGAAWVLTGEKPTDGGSSRPLTKASIDDYMTWSSSRYNEMPKATAVDRAFRILQGDLWTRTWASDDASDYRSQAGSDNIQTRPIEGDPTRVELRVMREVYESGNYTEAAGGQSYGAYLVNGEDGYIAKGNVVNGPADPWHFEEGERAYFGKARERSG